MGTGSLLFNLAPHTKIPWEDIATYSLCSIVGESSVLMAAFTKLLCEHLYIPQIEDVCEYKTQVTGKKMERPDVVGFDGAGKEVLICEAKFYAALTENQPSTYLERLKEVNGKGLVFLCPKDRIPGLWKQLSETEGAEPIEDCTDCVSVQGIRLGIVSWEELLDRLQIVSEQNQEMRSDIQELEVYCYKLINQNTFIPFCAADFGADVAVSMARYYDVMDQLRDILLTKIEYGITQKGTSKRGLQSTPQMGGDYYIYMAAKECKPFLYFEKHAWRQQGSVCTPFWLALVNLEEWQDESIKEYINSLPKEKVEKSGRKGVLLIALEPPVGMTKEDTAQELCKQVLGYIDGYTDYKCKKGI